MSTPLVAHPRAAALPPPLPPRPVARPAAALAKLVSAQTTEDPFEVASRPVVTALANLIQTAFICASNKGDLYIDGVTAHKFGATDITGKQFFDWWDIKTLDRMVKDVTPEIEQLPPKKKAMFNKMMALVTHISGQAFFGIVVCKHENLLPETLVKSKIIQAHVMNCMR